MIMKQKQILEYCEKRLNISKIKDFNGASNGLQVANNGACSHIGAAVDANIKTFEKAIEAKVDFLIVHHGLFWNGITPITGTNYKKLKLLLDHNIALYSCHLPLDGHPEIGNNACLAKELGLEIDTWPIEYEGFPIVPVCKQHTYTQDSMRLALSSFFQKKIIGLEFGPKNLGSIAICSGSGSAVVEQMRKHRISTLITGELKQSNFSIAQEEGLNLYLCGHYTSERVGVGILGEELGRGFGVEYSFIENYCEL